MVVFEDKEVDEEQVRVLSITSKHNTNIITKNNPHEEMCLKCEKKLVNGVRCTRCRKAWHWKVKEIKSLRKNIIDLEKKLSGMNADLETHYSRITYLEDRLSKERNVRERFEKDFYESEELQKR